MSEERKPIVELGRGGDVIYQGKEGSEKAMLNINDLHSIEPTVAGMISESAKLGTLGVDFSTSTNSSAPELSILLYAMKKGVNENEVISNLFLHGNNTDKSMHRDGEIKPMSIEEKNDINMAMQEVARTGLMAQSEAQIAVIGNPDFGPSDPYAGSTVADFVSPNERENIGSNLDM